MLLVDKFLKIGFWSSFTDQGPRFELRIIWLSRCKNSARIPLFSVTFKQFCNAIDDQIGKLQSESLYPSTEEAVGEEPEKNTIFLEFLLSIR